ncbi:hypothetical protein FB451DRAFT_1186821 [Mycena latifolia]|nr:hypothetical protein FB451DRAFT_1186821 [Mycena latifolia]
MATDASDSESSVEANNDIGDPAFGIQTHRNRREKTCEAHLRSPSSSDTPNANAIANASGWGWSSADSQAKSSAAPSSDLELDFRHARADGRARKSVKCIILYPPSRGGGLCRIQIETRRVEGLRASRGQLGVAQDERKARRPRQPELIAADLSTIRGDNLKKHKLKLEGAWRRRRRGHGNSDEGRGGRDDGAVEAEGGINKATPPRILVVMHPAEVKLGASKARKMVDEDTGHTLGTFSACIRKDFSNATSIMVIWDLVRESGRIGRRRAHASEGEGKRGECGGVWDVDG